MANIFLTKKCNLNCPYCFADEFVNKDTNEISIENFKKALAFIKTDENERIGLIGGEPTIHSKFKEILEILTNDNKIKDVIIFTNGIEIDKYIEELKNEKFSILINCNSPKDIGIKNYEKLKNNISLLKEIKKEKYTLGINLYSENLDYSFIFELMNIANKKNLRFSTALPNDLKEKTFDIIESFKNFKPFLFKFFNDCLLNQIVPNNDCNSIPTCILNPEEMKLLIKLNKLGELNKAGSPIISCKTCTPVIDILPDLSAVRCFGLSKYTRISIKNFKKIENLRKYFFNKIDVYSRISFISEKCENCTSHFLEKCGICFTYKAKQMPLQKITLQ